MQARIILYIVYQLGKGTVPALNSIIQLIVYLGIPDIREDYQPIFRGPYSDQVQNTIQTLLKGEYLIPAPKEFHLNEEKLREKQGLTYDNLITDDRQKQNLEGVIDFLQTRHFDSVEAVSNLSKVHYLSVRIGYRGPDLIESVKHRAKYLGWTAIAEMEEKEVEALYTMSKNIEELLK